MFRCEFSGELSDGAVWQIVDSMNEGTKHRQRTRKLVKSAEKPVVIVVETRKKNYNNVVVTKKMRRGKEEESMATNISEGTEIVREIKVREKYAEEVKRLVAEGKTLSRKTTKRHSR